MQGLKSIIAADINGVDLFSGFRICGLICITAVTVSINNRMDQINIIIYLHTHRLFSISMP